MNGRGADFCLEWEFGAVGSPVYGVLLLWFGKGPRMKSRQYDWR
jgi:hypothetical protein